MLSCPICNGNQFLEYRKRKNARCSKCGAKERGRLMALTIHKFIKNMKSGKVYHFAPEEAIHNILINIFGEQYIPADYSPNIYGWSKIPVQKIDLSSPLSYLPEEKVQGLIHSHVLEHIPGSIDQIINEMNYSIQSGGFHLFQVPIENGWYREDMNPEMSPKEREERFFQNDHLRVFGKNDFNDRCLRLFTDFVRVDLSGKITQEELSSAAVPLSTLTVNNGHTPFLFIKK